MAVGGNPEKNQWKRVDVGNDPEHRELMLTTDVCMAFGNSPTYVKCMVDEKGRKKKAKFCGELGLRNSTALDPHFQECCTWVNANTLRKFGGFFDNGPKDYCGVSVESNDDIPGGGKQRKSCCKGMGGKGKLALKDCDSNNKP